MLWNDDLEAFLNWFVSSENAGKGKLKAALMSVPVDSFGTVWARLDQDLHEEMCKYMPVAQDVEFGRPIDMYIPSQEKNRKYDIADMKKTLVAEEFRRRQSQR